MKAILLNGPPRSGKDLSSQFILMHPEIMPQLDPIAIYLDKFSRPLKDMMVAFAMSNGCLHPRTVLDDKVKDEPQDYLDGLTPRQFQIWMSEEVVKPKFGDRYFGEMLARRALKQQRELVVVSDSGFRLEAEALVEILGANNVMLIRLHRAHCTYKNDSRGYIELADLGVTECDIENSTKDGLKLKLRNHINAWWGNDDQQQTGTDS